MCNEYLARVCQMLFVAPFRILIASFLGDALDAVSSCSCRPDCLSAGCLRAANRFAPNFFFISWFVPPFSGVSPCRPSSTTRASLPASSSSMLDLLGLYSCYSSPRSSRSPSAWTAHTPVNIVYLEASIPYYCTCSLWPKIFLSRMSASDTRLVEPLSLVKAPSSPLYDFSKVSLIWMFVFFLLSEDLGCAFFESIFFSSLSPVLVSLLDLCLCLSMPLPRAPRLPGLYRFKAIL